MAGIGDFRGALHDLHQGLLVLEPQGHEHPRHEREVEGHVEAVAVPEVGPDVLRPHVGLGEEHPSRELGVHPPSQLPDDPVRLGQVLAGCALPLHEVGHRVHPEPVHPDLEPEAHHLPDLLAHRRVVEVEVGLVREEAVPVVGLGDGVPGPVRHLGVAEDDPHAAVAVVRVAPDVVVALRAVGRGAGLLEPGVLVGGVVDHELGDHLEAPRVGAREKGAEVGERAELGVDGAVVGDVVPVVAEGRRVHGQQPDAVDAEVLQVVQPGHEAREVPHAVPVGVGVGLDVQLVEDRVLVPEVVAHGGSCDVTAPAGCRQGSRSLGALGREPGFRRWGGPWRAKGRRGYLTARRGSPPA